MATTQTITYKLKEMKWIKASKRLPDIKHNYHVKVLYNQEDETKWWNTSSVYNGDYWEHPYSYNSYNGMPMKITVFEWLDESDDQEISSLNEILSQKMELLVKANEEIERLKGLIEIAYKDSYKKGRVHPSNNMNKDYEQFKTENKL